MILYKIHDTSQMLSLRPANEKKFIAAELSAVLTFHIFTLRQRKKNPTKERGAGRGGGEGGRDAREKNKRLT